MPVTIGFQGLCAMVSEKQDVATSITLNVLLVDAIKAGLTCPHEQKLDLPAANLDDPNSLTVAGSSSSRRTLELAGKQLRFLPSGANTQQTGFGTANLNLIPEMRQVCNLGTVDSDCFSTAPTKPIAARVTLPPGGTVSGNPGNLTAEEWSFAPPVSSCYHGIFTKEVLFELPASDSVVIEVDTIGGRRLGTLTLRTTAASLNISNLCTREPIGTPSDDTLVYFELLDPPFSGILPRARPNATCTMPVTQSPGIGCVPFLLSQT
jgi:hypothetical protein